MEEIKFCPRCGHANKGSSNFCENCGAPLNDETNENTSYHADQSFSSQANQTASFNETPVIEKTKYQTLNYSQALRSLLFGNPIPLISGSVMFILLLSDILISYFVTNTVDTFTTLGFIFLAVDLVYLFYYLIVSPLRSISMSKHLDIEDFRISFFMDRLRYQMKMNYKGQEARNDFFLLYRDIYKVKEYKDMMILGFFVNGAMVPICVLKDENYDKTISLMQKRIDEIRNKK